MQERDVESKDEEKEKLTEKLSMPIPVPVPVVSSIGKTRFTIEGCSGLFRVV